MRYTMEYLNPGYGTVECRGIPNPEQIQVMFPFQLPRDLVSENASNRQQVKLPSP